MASLCTEHHHHHHHHMKYRHLVSPKKSLQDLNIPPRKLLSRRPNPSSDPETYFLPCNGDNSSGYGYGYGYGSDDGFDPDSDPYSSDQFRMYEFKVRKCTRSRSHDWTDCPFSHPGEKARRRDPRRFHYSGTVCPEYRRSGVCSKGDECVFGHGVFECWLHPARYRTEGCKDGKGCKRKVCFFAHTPRELRVLPPPPEECEDIIDNLDPDRDFDNNGFNNQHQKQKQWNLKSMAMGGGRGLWGYAEPGDEVAVFRMNNNNKGSTITYYEDKLIAELIGYMDLNESVQSPNNKRRGLWDDNSVVNPDPRDYDNNQQFSFSHATTYFTSNNASPISVPIVVNGVQESPHLGWVNDLLT